MLMSSDKAVYSLSEIMLCVKIEFIKFYVIKFEILKRIKVLETSLY